MEATLEALRHVGIRWPRQPSDLRAALEIARTDWMLRGPLDARRFPERPPDDARWLAPTTVIDCAGNALVSESPKLVFVALASALRFRCRAGGPFGPGYLLTAYAGCRASALGDARRSLRLAQAALEWMKRDPHPAQDVRGIVLLHTLLRPWTEPRRRVLADLRGAGEQARELGDLIHLGYARRYHVDYAALTGEPLPSVMAELEALQRREQQQMLSYYADSFVRLYRLLRPDAAGAGNWRHELRETEERLADSRDVGLYGFWIHWVMVLVFLGERPVASRVAERISRKVFTVGTPGSLVVDYTLLRGLAALLSAQTARGAQRRTLLRVGRACERKLRGWARRNGNPDFAHMAQLLAAERLHLRGDLTGALARYRQAIRSARNQGYRHHAALALERTADALLAARRAQEACAALREASALYESWGSSINVAAVARRLAALDRG
jgi:hypothetical protein